MQYTLALLALAASVCAQGVTQIISPPAPAPTGCSTSFTGNFMINSLNLTTASKKRGLEKRATACGGTGTLVLSLQDGVLKDAHSATGYIADNRQFQFDNPPQTGAIYTAGFSVCANDTLALGGSIVFWQCLSGNFYNLYDRTQGAQCNQAYFEVTPCVVAGAPTIVPSSVTTTPSTATTTALPSSAAVVILPTTSIQSTSQMSRMTSSTMTVSSAVGLGNTTVTTSTMVGTATSSTTVLSRTTATGITTSSPPIAASSGAASILSGGKEFAALVAGLAALVVI